MNIRIYNMINEQFNIANMDFNNTKQKVNLFNKEPEYVNIYRNMLSDNTVSVDDIKYMNKLVAVVKPKEWDEIRKIIQYYSENYPTESLNWLDVSEITDMEELFANTVYNGDISKWDVSHVKNMKLMFMGAKFKGDISKWNVSRVKNMQSMFSASDFNGDISNWDVSHVTDMFNMFGAADFNREISNWDVSRVKDMSYMFAYSKFKKNISNWKISSRTKTEGMY